MPASVAHDQAVSELAKLIAVITGDEDAAPGLAEDLVTEAEDQLPDLEPGEGAASRFQW